MNAYITMTLIGLAAKLGAGYALHRYWCNSLAAKLVTVLIVCLVAQSICELSIYAFTDKPDSPFAHLLMEGYYSFSFLLILLFPFVTASATGMNINRYLVVASAIVFVSLVSILFTTQLIVAGVEALDYSLTRTPGPYYFVFQVSALLSALFTIVTLIQARSHYSIHMRTKATNLLLAFIPVLAFTIFIVFAMQLGFPVNAAGVLPLCLVLHTAALIHNLHDSRIPDYLSYIPWSKKSRIIRDLSKPFRVIDLSPADSKELAKLYEQALIQYAVEMFDDRKAAAQWLNISQAKISKIIGNRRNRRTESSPEETFQSS